MYIVVVVVVVAVVVIVAGIPGVASSEFFWEQKNISQSVLTRFTAQSFLYNVEKWPNML